MYTFTWPSSLKIVHFWPVFTGASIGSTTGSTTESDIYWNSIKPLTNKRWQRNYSLLPNINSRIIMTWIITIIIILLIFKNHLHFNLNDPPINIKIHMFKMSNFKIQINKLIYFYRIFQVRRCNFKRPTSAVFMGMIFDISLIWEK